MKELLIATTPHSHNDKEASWVQKEERRAPLYTSNFMKLSTLMHTNVYTLYQSSTLAEAISLMETKAIRHIPIVDEFESVIGMLSDRDIRDIRPSTLMKEKDRKALLEPISNLMKTPVLTAHPEDDIQEVAKMFYQNKIGCLPVVNREKLVGICTESDLLQRLTEIIGCTQPSSLIEVRVVDQPGKLAEIAGIFKRLNMNITSALMYTSQLNGHVVLSFRVETIDPRRAIEEIKKEGYEVHGPRLPGVEE
ncbi:acetoin utilization AcuB family protein [Shouchella shacheensis]|uniref:acetoin utilization AcuB family protein n=1 Tax=Shouchella shacheensis TaxID=1649580 RepID=UPI000740199B|nr:acetoin utilization AcuB family protein [Shouchella shacheensis]